MHAKAGDWLVVERADIEHEPRKGLIQEVRSADGSPPYLVRWTDDDHIALVFPGADAHVLTEAELEFFNERRAQRFTRLQSKLAGGSTVVTGTSG